jgi:hypothetical protein
MAKPVMHKVPTSRIIFFTHLFLICAVNLAKKR